MTNGLWPALPYHECHETLAGLHLRLQVIGKVALAQAPPLNHCWGVALQVTARGLATRLLPYTDRAFSLECDLIAHRIVARTTDGRERTLPLVAQSTAAFYQDMVEVLRSLDLPVRIWPMPVELPAPIRFEADTADRPYDREAANRFWRILVQADRVLRACRARFLGKCSPVHFFWGACDLAVTRFSGRPAPPREGPAFMRDAYSHEVISHGFWPGSDPVFEPAFYAYAVPEPAGLREARIRPDAAYYHTGLGEFILPYEAVRTAAAPDAALAAFVESTYERAATLAGWDRAALERAATPAIP